MLVDGVSDADGVCGVCLECINSCVDGIVSMVLTTAVTKKFRDLSDDVVGVDLIRRE